MCEGLQFLVFFFFFSGTWLERFPFFLPRVVSTSGEQRTLPRNAAPRLVSVRSRHVTRCRMHFQAYLPPTNWKLISLIAIVRSSRRFRMSKSPVRKTVSSFKLDNLSALRSEWKLHVRAREKLEKRRNVRTVGNCIYSPRNVLSDIIRPYVCVKMLSLKYCATVYFNVSIAVILAGKTHGGMALTFLYAGSKYLRLNMCAQLSLIRGLSIYVFHVMNFNFCDKRFFFKLRESLFVMTFYVNCYYLLDIKIDCFVMLNL